MKVLGVCPHDCPDSCGVVTEVEGNRAVKFYADPNHPITQGWLCAKVRPYLDHVYHPDRLTTPLRRVGEKGGGDWRAISWKEAVSEIGERWRGIIAKYGAEAILPYSYSGTLGMVQNVVSANRFWNRLGASQLQRSICGAAGETAVELTLGVRFSQPYAAIKKSKLVVVWGHNPVSTAPHFMPALRQAQRKGAKLLVIDPRRTRTAKGADWHLAPKPATDGALALGLAHLIVENGWHDPEWLNKYTVGWQAMRDRLADYPPQRVAAICGIVEADLRRLAKLYAQTKPSLIKFADGIQRHPNGGQTIRSILSLPAITGQYGAAGGGISYSSGGITKWDAETISHWGDCPAPGRWVNMNRLGAALLGEVTDPPIQSLYIFNANPVASAPNAGKIIAGLKRDDLFTVVHDLFLTDSADYADIVLPATSQLEQLDLHKAYGHTVLSLNSPAIPPLGESNSNWQTMRLLAAEMGFDEPWLQDEESKIIVDLLEKSAPDNLHLAGITLERLKEEGSIPFKLSNEIPFADGVFPTPSGKVELWCDGAAEHGLDPLPAFAPAIDDSRPANANGDFLPADALNLISGAAHYFVSSSLANQAGLIEREGDPFVEIHPQDAGKRGIKNGDWVIVENKRGCSRLLAKVTDGVRPGVIVSPKGRWHKRGSGNVNMTTSDAIGDLAGQSSFHTNSVWLRRE